MRVDSEHWTVAEAVIIGHAHKYSGRNCQDAAGMVVHPHLAIGVGCDGCGEGMHSEMGALNLSNFVLHEATQLHLSGFTIAGIVDRLFPSVIRFIDINVSLSCPDKSTKSVANYIKEYWLATIRGFLVDNDGNGLFFWSGDGVRADDNGLIETEEDNKPRYIAYNCVYNPTLVGVTDDVTPKEFGQEKIVGATKVMVASDGFNNHNMITLGDPQMKHPELTDNLDGQQWGKKGNFGLKKWMNTRSNFGYFDDDCFIVTAEKI